MPTPEELERRRQRNQEYLERKRQTEASAEEAVRAPTERPDEEPSGGMRSQWHRPLGIAGSVAKDIWGSKPVQMALDYPRMVTSGGIQQFGETREVMRDRGVLPAIGHAGRELLSTGLDVAADVSKLPTFGMGKGLIPESWGEAIDPSQATEMGMRVEAAKERIRREEGRAPTLTEEYDIMAEVQDEVMPWLTERWKLGPFDMSKRFGLELGGEITAGIVETAATFGTAALAKAPLRAAAKMAGKQGVVAGAQRAALQSVGQVLKGPMYVDRAVGRIMGTAIKAPFRASGIAIKGAIKVPGTTKGVITTLANQTRRILRSQGVSSEEAYRGTKQQADSLSAVNGQGAYTPRDMATEVLDAAPPDPIPWEGTALNSLVGGAGTPEVVIDPTGWKRVGIALKPIDLLRTLREETPYFANELHAKLVNINVPIVRDSTKPFKDLRITRDEMRHQRIGREQGKKNTQYEYKLSEIQESTQYNDGERIGLLVRTLNNAGLLASAKGGDVDAAVKRIESDVSTASGMPLSEVYGGVDKEFRNLYFIDDFFKKNDIRGDDGEVATFLGHTLVAAPGKLGMERFKSPYADWGGTPIQSKYVDAAGELEWVAPDLPPGFSDLMERFPRYRRVLQQVPIEGLPGVETAYEAILELSKIAKRIEGADIALGTPHVGKKHGVLYDQGASAWPRGAEDQAGEEIAIQFQKNVPAAVHALEFASAAEGMFHGGVVYGSPAQAMIAGIGSLFSRVGAAKTKEAVQKTAGMYGIKVTTLEDLIASKVTTALDADINAVRAALHHVVIKVMGQEARKAERSAARATESLSKSVKPEGASQPAYDAAIREAPKRTSQELKDLIKESNKYLREHKGAEFAKQRQISEMTIRVAKAELDRRSKIKVGKATPTVPDMEGVGPSLPRELSRSAPRYRRFKLQFERDLDKALYILAQDKRSAGDAKFLKFVMDATGMDEASARAAGRGVKAAIGGLARAAGGTETLIVPRGTISPTFTPLDRPLGPASVRTIQGIIDEIDKISLIDNKLTPVDTGDIPDIVGKNLSGVEKTIEGWEETFLKLTPGERAPIGTQFESIRSRLGRAKAGAIARTKEINANMNTLKEYGFEGHYFPKTFADAILETDEALKIKKDPIRLVRWMKSLNGSLRTMGATADMSGVGIQGIVPLYNDILTRGGSVKFLPGGTVKMTVNHQGDTFTAFKASVEAMANRGAEIMQEHWWRFDQEALANSTITSRELVGQGLSLTQTGPDLYASKLGNLPGMAKFNRAFTHFGNALRASMADAEIADYMIKHKVSLEEMLASGKVAEICGVINLMTGVGKRGFGGEAGQFLFFAPRFMHARLKTMGLAARGMLPGEKTLQQRVAARYMSRYMGMAVLLTVTINEAQGKETDLSPVIRDPSTGKWRANPNFLRAHVGKLDVSLLGPYDTMIRIIGLPAFVALNVRKFGDLTEVVRSTISAPISSAGWDIASGRDPMGEALRDPEASLFSAEGIQSIVPTLLERSTPFAMNEIFVGRPGRPSVRERFLGGVGEGDIGEAGTAAGQTALQVLGGRSTYETPAETMKEMLEEVMGLGPDDPRVQAARPEDMSEAEFRSIWENLEQGFWSKLIDEGKNFRMSLSLRGAMGLGKEPTPTWDMVADDIDDNVQDLVAKGRFNKIMTPQTMEEIQGRIHEAVAAGADDYNRYSVAREALKEEEGLILEGAEADLAAGRPIILKMTDPETGEMTRQELSIPKGDLAAYLKQVNKIRGTFAQRRSNLTSPEGKYSGVIDLFDFANSTALGTLSTFDSNIFDTAEARYYKVLYEKTVDDGMELPSIVGINGDIDWDLRDQKLAIWAKQMKKQFPDLSKDEIERFRRRVENARKKQAPELAGMLLDMQDYIKETELAPDIAPGVSYYDIEEFVVDDILKRYKGIGTKEQYRLWKNASKDTKKDLEAENKWLGYASKIATQRRDQLIMRNDLVDGIMQVLERRTAVTSRGKIVASILSRNRTGQKKIEDMGEFLGAVYSGASLDVYR